MSENDVQLLAAKMDAGFEKIYLKLDAFELRFSEHKEACMGRFAGITATLAVDHAIYVEDKKHVKEKLDFWKWAIRGTTGVIATGAALLIWKLLTGTAKIIIG